MNQEDRQDRIADPVLAAAMQELRTAATYDMDWDRLRRSINERAELPLARRRSRAMRRPRPFLPIAIAASLAFAIWTGPTIVDRVFGPEAPQVAVLEGDEMLIHALGGDLTEQEFEDLVTGRTNPEVLLAVAISGR